MSDSESESSLSDDPIEEEQPVEEDVLEKPKRARGRPKKEKSEIVEKKPKPVEIAPIIKKERKKSPNWTPERKKEFAERMKKAREAKKLNGESAKDKKKKEIPEQEPHIAELIAEGKKARKAKYKADIKKEALKILKQEAAEGVVSDSDSSDSDPDMKQVKKYITKRKAKKKAREIKPKTTKSSKPKKEVVYEEQVSQINEPMYQFL